MAIADKALYDIESLEDLLKMEIPASQDELELFFKDTVLDLPILRRCTKEKGTTEEIMPKNAFLRIFRDRHRLSQAWYTGVMELMRLHKGLTIYCDMESIGAFS